MTTQDFPELFNVLLRISIRTFLFPATFSPARGATHIWSPFQQDKLKAESRGPLCPLRFEGMVTKSSLVFCFFGFILTKKHKWAFEMKMDNF